MGAMEGLGRAFNIVPIAAGRGLSMVGCRGITFITTGNDTFTFTEAVTFAGSYQAIPNLTQNVYTSSATNGSAAWTKNNALRSTNTIVSGGAVTTAIYIPGDFLDDTYAYIKCSVGGSGLVTAIMHDLYVQRTPPNLAIVSA
jgi:hypothetical protein